MRQEVQVYVTIKLKGLSQRFEESVEGDRQMGFGVVHCCYYDKIYLQLKVVETMPKQNISPSTRFFPHKERYEIFHGTKILSKKLRSLYKILFP